MVVPTKLDLEEENLNIPDEFDLLIETPTSTSSCQNSPLLNAAQLEASESLNFKWD